jgi:hypothetical protein
MTMIEVIYITQICNSFIHIRRNQLLALNIIMPIVEYGRK